MDRLVNRMRCVFCAAQRPDNGSLTSKEHDKRLKEWHRQEERVVKLLLLGIGESGKSTLTKQMHIIHMGDFTESERLEKRPDIRNNIKVAMEIILGAMTNLGIMSSLDPSLATSAEFIRQCSTDPTFTFTPDYYDHVDRLWQDRGLQNCYLRSNEYQLFDSAKYFLDRVSIVRQDDYVPTDQDLLRCRVMTNTIQKIKFKVMDDKSPVEFSVFDVGGQQGERRKWIQVFDTVTAILFVVDCSCFDLTLREEVTKNRFLESMETFEQVWNNRWLRQTPVVIFLNKIDLLEEKMAQGRQMETLVDSLDSEHHYYNLLQSYHKFLSPRDDERREFIASFPKTQHDSIDNQVIRTAIFIKRTFMHLVHHPSAFVQSRPTSWHSGHSCEIFFTCAVDTQTIRKVLEGCRTIIIRKVLEKWGM